MRSCARARALAAVLVLAAPAFARAQPPPPPSAAVRLLDVPYIQQSEALCGGAAAAMVMRYWGATGVYAETFAPLVDRTAGGIRGEDLLRDLGARGWDARSFRGDRALVQARLSAGQPVIALIEDRPGTYHYVVIVAWANERLVYHDPARAPFRVVSETAFGELWGRAGNWTLLTLPKASTDRPIGASADRIGSSADRIGASADRIGSSACDPLVAEGVRLGAAGDHEAAMRTLGAAADGCPADAGPWREMAGVYAIQKKWTDAAAAAREAVRRDRGDAHAWRILATSRYVTDDGIGALDAWNAVGEPRLDIVNISGLEHMRHPAAAAAMRLQTETVLTPAALAAAGRRLGEVPAAQVARVAYRPLENGRAAVDAVLIERPRSPFTVAGLVVAGLGALTDREVALSSANPTGAGDLATVSWRWWENRPRVAASYAAPMAFGGVLRTDIYRDEQTYGADSFAEVRKGGAVTFSDWTTKNLRWQAGLGADTWNGRGTTVSAAAGVEQRLVGDRVALDATSLVLGGSFTAWTAGAGISWRSALRHERTVLLARAGVDVASDDAPLALWPGAGVGHAREGLLRAHRLLDDGVVTGEVFGRTLYSAGIEARRWSRPLKGAIRLAPAVFIDTARAERRLADGDAWHVDAGAGLRIAIPGSNVLRIDVARGLRDGKTVVSVGWTR